MKALDRTFTTQIADIETELVASLPTQEQEACEEGEPSLDRAWALTIARLQTIPGIGFLPALWIVVITMNFRLCSSAEQAAAYAGLAPMPRESGTSVYKRPRIGHTGNGDCEQHFIWQRSQLHATIRSSKSFMTDYVLRVNRRK
jgi:transposase